MLRCMPAATVLDHALRADTTRVDRGNPATAILSTGYRPLGSCSRAAGWSEATLCYGPTGTSRHVRANVRFQGHCGTARHREDRITLPRITIWNAAFNIGRCSALRLFPSATL